MVNDRNANAIWWWCSRIPGLRLPHDRDVVSFFFFNPASGPNICRVVSTIPDLMARCAITPGVNAVARFYVGPSLLLDDDPDIGDLQDQLQDAYIFKDKG